MRRLKRDNPVPEFRDWLLGTSAASERSCWPRTRRCCTRRSVWACPIADSSWPEPAAGKVRGDSEPPGRAAGPPAGHLQAVHRFEVDHVIPVSQPLSGQQQELQALCLECHRTKTSLEGNHSTNLESRFCRYDYLNYAASPRLPPLVFQLQK
ncbi:unnamed protein product [Symbiodinium microadriaticum]|nr:unnamed protein product [Symbiodinium microadriaticum]